MVPFRTPDELALSGALVIVRTGGRALGGAEGVFSLLGTTSSIRVAAPSDAPLPTAYALVEVEGAWDGTRLVATRLAQVGGPMDGALAADGDLMFLQHDGGRRARALTARSRAMRAIRAYFDAEGFLEVDTPTVIPSPGIEVHLSAFAVDDGGYLGTSPEYQMKRLLSAGFSRIYQLGRSYRRDEAGPTHEPEFCLLEWYRAYAGVDAVMADTERVVAALAEATIGGTRTPPCPGAPGGCELAPPWERLTVAEAYARYAGVDVDELVHDEARFYQLMVDVVQPQLGVERPVFLTRWPASMASLARLCPDDPRYAERFEAYAAGVELCNGFGELTDPREQRARFERDVETRASLGLAAYPIDERFLRALEDGVPPSGGNAVGVDRVLMLVTGATSIEDVVWFSRRRL